MSAVIKLSNVSKTYLLGGNRVSALQSIDVEVKQGEFTALKGPSGSGKSTLLNICGLLDQADTGSYQFNGERVDDLDAYQLARLRRDYIGFVFQHFNLIPTMSIYENIEYPLLLNKTPPLTRHKLVLDLLDHVELGPFARQRPDHLSGGQRQRAAIARALVKIPALVIADEPSANLDTATAQRIIDLMHALGRAKQTTFLIATHDERMSERCDRILTLSDGVLQ